MLTKYIANKMIIRKLEEKRFLLVERYRFFEEKYIEKTEELDLYLLYKEILDLDEGLLVLYKKIQDFLNIWKDFGEQWVEDKKIDFQIDPAWEDFGKVTDEEYLRSREEQRIDEKKIDFQIDPAWEDFGKVSREEQRVDEKKIDFQIDPAWEDFGKVIEEEGEDEEEEDEEDDEEYRELLVYIQKNKRLKTLYLNTLPESKLRAIASTFNYIPFRDTSRECIIRKILELDKNL